MRIKNVTPVAGAKPRPDGRRPIARFQVTSRDGFTIDLTLVQTVDDQDIIWSALGPTGPSVRLSRALQAELAAAVRERLAEMAVALRDAA